MKTTLNKIRAFGPCAEGWEKLLRTLNKTKPDDEPLSIVDILNSNGLDDALWCLCAVDGHDREIRLFAVWCARQVQHLMTDPRSVNALDVAERYANGHASEEELRDAWEAAGDAARATQDVAGSAARAAQDAAGDAPWEAARTAASSAEWATEWAAARAAERAKQTTKLRRICAEIEEKETA